MEKYARQAVSEGVKNADDLRVGGDSEIYRVLNLHYNRNNHIEVNWRSWRYVDWTFTLAWISRVTNFSEIIISRKIVSNATPFISSQYLNTSRRNEESDPDHQPPARPQWFANQISGVGIELSESKFRWERENWPGVGDRPRDRRNYSAVGHDRVTVTSPFSSRGNAFKRIRVWFVSVSVERRVLQITRTSLTFPLWGAIYFRHGVTTVDCICNAAAAAAAAGDGCAHVKQLFNII